MEKTQRNNIMLAFFTFVSRNRYRQHHRILHLRKRP